MDTGEKLYMEFGKRLQSMRQYAGLTQETVAMRIGLTRTSINNIEHGRQRILLHTLYDLANALGCAPDALLPLMTPITGAGEEELPADLAPEEQRWVRTVLTMKPGKVETEGMHE